MSEEVQPESSEDAQAQSLSQETYRPTPYADSDWEVIGERLEADDFESMKIEVLDRGGMAIDPMFANYGGIPTDKEGLRWHLPEGATAAEARPSRSAKEEAAQRDPGIALEEVEARIAQAVAETEARLLAAHQAEMQAKLQAVEGRMKELFSDLVNQSKEQSVKLESSAVELALEIARKIIGTAVEINPEYIVQVVREALAQAGAASVKKVRVSSEDMEFIEVIGVAKYIKEFDGTWQFEADGSIRAGCVVETSAGEIDFQLDKAWERIRDEAIKVTR